MPEQTPRKAPSPTQLTLAPVHRDDGPESRLAAEKVDKVVQFHRVLRALYYAPQALTDDEIAQRCGLLRTSAGTRRGVAVKRGLVERAGRGVSALGNPASTWRLTSEGRAYVEAMNRSEAA